MTELIPNLFIGNWHEAREAKRNGFHVVTVAIDSPFIGDDHIGLVDGPGNSKDNFDLAVSVTVERYKTGKKVMVHCIGGRSRSAAVIVAATRILTERALCDVYDDLLRKHDGAGTGARIHPHLSTMLLAYE